MQYKSLTENVTLFYYQHTKLFAAMAVEVFFCLQTKQNNIYKGVKCTHTSFKFLNDEAFLVMPVEISFVET